jgi:hypothetical protein
VRRQFAVNIILYLAGRIFFRYFNMIVRLFFRDQAKTALVASSLEAVKIMYGRGR